jgi:hypothetical protein
MQFILILFLQTILTIMNSNRDFLKSILYNGLIMAGVFILLDLIFYVFDFSGIGMLLGLFIYLVFLAIYFIFFIYGGRNYRNKFMGGYMKYKKAFLYCLLMAVVFVLVMFIYQLLFYNFFDPERVSDEIQKGVEMIQDNSYIPDDAKEEALKKIMSATANSTVFRNLTNNIITSVIIGAISALFIRKKEKFTEVF